MLDLVKSPGIDKQALAKTIFTIANEASDVSKSDERMNFVSLLAQNSRLEALPEIKEQFQQMKQELEKVVEATITSASEISNESLNVLSKTCTVNVSLSTSKVTVPGVRVMEFAYNTCAKSDFCVDFILIISKLV